MNEVEASAALDAVASARQSIAAASAAPLWRHAAFAAVMALIILSVAIDGRLRIIPFLGSMAGLVLLIQWDRRQTGMFVNGYRRGATLPLTLALLVAVVALAFTAVRLGSNGTSGLALLTVPATFVIALGASLWWERIFLRELGTKR